VDRNVRALILALLCVLAVSLAAATLANPQQPAGAGDGTGGIGPGDGGTASQQGSGGDGGMNNPEPDDGTGTFRLGPACVPALTSPAFGVGILAACLLVGGVAYRRDGLAPAVAVLFVSVTVLFPAWLLLTSGCSTSGITNQDGGVIPPITSGNATGGVTGGGSGGATAFSPPVVLGVLLVVALVLVVVAFRATGDDEPPDDDPVPERTGGPDEEALGALGDVAGDAADRIDENADLENEVYRAWREMTDHLDVDNPAASTPGEFAAAARDAGMDDGHVDELTDLFRAVRYGGADVTDDRERRAVDALRAIESSYGGDR
jgi:hypothetical protein